MMLNSLHVPLVHNNNHILALSLINLTEQFFIFLVNKDLLELGEEDVCRLDEPVHQRGVEAFLSKGTAGNDSKLLPVR